jgi:hypothetical protein
MNRKYLDMKIFYVQLGMNSYNYMLLNNIKIYIWITYQKYSEKLVGVEKNKKKIINVMYFKGC